MIEQVERVGFKQVYDLVFRAKNARLKSVAYVLDYYDWMKAGIAFNTRGFELSTRKISYFAQLYGLVTELGQRFGELSDAERQMLETSLTYYYADIFEVYQDHVRSKHSEAAMRNRDGRKSTEKLAPEFGNLIVLPSFDCVPAIKDVFQTKVVDWDCYQCQNVSQFNNVVASAYVKQGMGLYSCMSLMYDYGVHPVETGVLLEVKLWDKE